MSPMRRLKRHAVARRLLASHAVHVLRSWLRPRSSSRPTVDDAATVALAAPVEAGWPEGTPRPRVALAKDHASNPWWPKFERFLEHNGFDYDIVDIHRSDWLERIKTFDAFVWRPRSHASVLEEARRKVYVLESHVGIRCLPSYRSLLLYEDKLLQYYLLRHHDLPTIRTFASHDAAEARERADSMRYPVVSKLVTGSGSEGVELIPDVGAYRRLAASVFSPIGRATYWGYLRQKDYLLLQDYVEHDGYDLRIIVVGDAIFGYYRRPVAGDFRASGSGLVEKREIPTAAMRLALDVCAALDERTLAVDFLRDRTGAFQIIEVSAFIRVDTPEQLVVAGKPGMYLVDRGTFTFVPGRYWIQELALKDFLRRAFIEGGETQL